MPVIREIHGRVLAAFLNYMRLNHPARWSEILGLLPPRTRPPEEEWYSYQTCNLVMRAAMEIAGNQRLPEIIGRLVSRRTWHEWMGFSVSVFAKPARLLGRISRQFYRWNQVSEIRLVEATSDQVVIENRMKSGFIATPAFCALIKGMLQGIMASTPVLHPETEEMSCAATAGREAPCRYRVRWRGRASLWARLRQGWNGWKTLFRMQAILRQQSDTIADQRWKLDQAEENIRRLQNAYEQHICQLEGRNLRVRTALHTATGKLREWDGMKSYMLSITSHELRTPLTIIKGALRLIESEGEQLGPERTKKYLVMAERNTERLIRLLNDIMDFSRLEFGHLKLDLVPTDLVRLLRETAEDFREESQRRQIAFACLVDEDLPPLTGDAGRIRQICNNLIANAMKFTPAGGRVELRARRFGEFVEIVVADNGVGISPEDQEKIFQKFQQVEDSLRREVEGVGLGLAIVRELTRLHDGKIRVESMKGEGSRFYVLLPLHGPLDRRGGVARAGLPESSHAPLVMGNHADQLYRRDEDAGGHPHGRA